MSGAGAALLLAALLQVAQAAQGTPERKITPVLNPDCHECNDDNTTLVYVRCDGAADTVHQIWDFTRGKPTIIFAMTDLNDTLEVRWKDDRPQEFRWTRDPKYSFALVINNIWEYNDVKDVGPIDTHNAAITLDTALLRWRCVELALEQKETMLHVQAEGYRSQDERRKGTFSLKFNLVPFTDFATDLPHLIHSSNSTLVDYGMINVTTSKHFNCSRFALEFLLISTDNGGDQMRLNVRKSMDDEHTPGIFEIVEITTPESSKHGDGGFMEYRPVAYTAAFREVTASTIVHAGDFNRTTELPRWSTVSLFYKDIEPQNRLMQSILISVGESGDGFYKKTNYTAWSFTVGYGLPPVEGFSLLVTIIISIGLGVPALMLMFGGLYMLMRHRSAHQHQRLRE